MSARAKAYIRRGSRQVIRDRGGTSRTRAARAALASIAWLTLLALALGIALVAVGGGARLTDGAWAARALAAAPTSYVATRSKRLSAPGAGPQATDRPAPVGVMQIPAIELRTPFYAGIHDAVVARGPGLWPGTPPPGARGNAVLAGHRTTHTKPFEHLDRLEPGDVIRTRLRGRAARLFRVTRVIVVPEARYVRAVLRPTRDRVPEVTLFACAPKGERTHRIVVRARAVDARA